MDFLKLIWVIPLFPAAGAVINGLLGKRLPKRLIDVAVRIENILQQPL